MHPTSPARLTSRISSLSGLCSVLIGTVVIIGWQFDISLFKSLHPDLVSMKANTALGFILAGIALWLRSGEMQSQDHKPAYLSDFSAVVIVIIGSATLIEYACGINLGIDQLLFREPIGAVDTLSPGRMAPITALCFLLLGVVFIVKPKSEQAYNLVQAMTLIVFVTAYISILGYIFKAPNISGLGRGTIMAVHTALTFLALSIGTLYLWPQQGVVMLLSSEAIAGRLTRRLLPIAILVPSLLGFLKLTGEHYGLYENHFGAVLVVVSTIVVFSMFVVWSARSIEKSDVQRRRAENELNRYFQLLSKTGEIARIGGWELTLDTMELFWTEQVYRMHEIAPGTRVTVEEALGFYTPEAKPIIQDAVKAAIETGSPFNLELQINTALNNSLWVRARGEAEYTDGEIVKIIGSFQDITQRKMAEDELRKSESHFRTLVSTIPDLIWLKDTEGVYLACNAKFERFFGAKETDIVGKTDYDFVDKEMADFFREHDRKAIAVGKPSSNEEWITFPDNGERILLYTTKMPMHQADGKLLGVLGIGRDITELNNSVEELVKREATFRAVAELSPMAIYASSGSDQKGVYANEAFSKIFGFSMEDIPTVEHWWLHAFPDEKYRQQVIDQWVYNIEEAGRNNTDVEALECVCTCKDGSEKTIAWVGKTIGEEFWAFGYDLTERKHIDEEKAKLESQLYQAQKMESIGSLAGGVAHDFNNKLSVILGCTYLAFTEEEPDKVKHLLEEIRKAAEQSADLTRQLLAFARKQAIAPKVLDLNETVTGMLKMLNRLIGEDIRLTWQPAPGLWLLKFDPSQVDQILANLCVNARDSISKDGKISIETGNCVIDEDYCAHHTEALPGEYVQLVVSDNGCGMDNETQNRIFEPFFTTKESGKGTGLGLATVFGIVKQNNGFINVYSEAGIGTSFTIYLPRHLGNNMPTETKNLATPAPVGLETILLVEDELAIMNIASMILTKQGYTVLSANSPVDAIRLAKISAVEINLLLTDVIMPDMNGKELANILRTLYPQLKTLYMSGYTADAIAIHGVLDDGVHFIQKPFSLPDLAVKVRAVIDGK